MNTFELSEKRDKPNITNAKPLENISSETNEALKQKALQYLEGILKEKIIYGKFGTDWMPEDFIKIPKLKSELVRLIHEKSKKFPIEMLDDLLRILQERKNLRTSL